MGTPKVMESAGQSAVMVLLRSQSWEPTQMQCRICGITVQREYEPGAKFAPGSWDCPNGCRLEQLGQPYVIMRQWDREAGIEPRTDEELRHDLLNNGPFAEEGGENFLDDWIARLKHASEQGNDAVKVYHDTAIQNGRSWWQLKS